MRRVLDAPGASSTPADTFSGDVNEGYAEFQAEQRARTSAEVETPPEVAPDSEPVIPAGDEPATPKQEPLTDEQKSAMKRANNEKRWGKLLRERDEAKAEVERLKTHKAEPAAPATAAKTVTLDKDAEPREDFDPSTGKPYEDFGKYVRDTSAYAAKQVIQAENERRAAETAQSKAKAQAATFLGGIEAYAKDHPGFRGTAEEPGAFETVRDELEDGLQVVSSAIVAHETPEELIDFLGTHPDAFDKILAHRGNPTRALIELGRLIATEFSPAEPPVTATPQRRIPPKPPAAVTARGHVPSGEAALDAAADANDFTAFQKVLRARDKRG